MATESPQRRKHVWPFYVAAGLVIGLIATSLWMTAAIRKARERRDYRVPMTNDVAPR